MSFDHCFFEPEGRLQFIWEQYQSEKKRADDAEEELERSKGELKQSQSEATELERLRSEVVELKRVESDVIVANEEAQQRESENDTLRENLAECDKEKKDFIQRLQNLNEEFATLHADSEARREAQDAQHSNLLLQNTNLQNQLSQETREVERLKALIDAKTQDDKTNLLRTEIQGLATEIKKLRDEINELTAENANLTTINRNINKQLVDSKLIVRELDERISPSILEERLKADRSADRARIDELVKQVDLKERALRDLEASKLALEDEVTRARDPAPDPGDNKRGARAPADLDNLKNVRPGADSLETLMAIVQMMFALQGTDQYKISIRNHLYNRLLYQANEQQIKRAAGGKILSKQRVSSETQKSSLRLAAREYVSKVTRVIQAAKDQFPAISGTLNACIDAWNALNLDELVNIVLTEISAQGSRLRGAALPR